MIIGSYAYYVGVGILSIIGYYEMLKVRQREKKIDLSVRIITLVSYLCIVLSAWNKTDFNIDYRLFILNLLVCYLPLIVFNTKDYDAEDALVVFAITVFLGMALLFGV